MVRIFASTSHCSFNFHSVRPLDTSAQRYRESAAMNDGDECPSGEHIAGFGEEEVEGGESESDDQPDCSEETDNKEVPETELGEEEVCPPQVATQPRTPSREEVDIHEAM